MTDWFDIPKEEKLLMNMTARAIAVNFMDKPFIYDFYLPSRKTTQEMLGFTLIKMGLNENSDGYFKGQVLKYGPRGVEHNLPFCIGGIFRGAHNRGLDYSFLEERVKEGFSLVGTREFGTGGFNGYEKSYLEEFWGGAFCDRNIFGFEEFSDCEIKKYDFNGEMIRFRTPEVRERLIKDTNDYFSFKEWGNFRDICSEMRDGLKFYERDER